VAPKNTAKTQQFRFDNKPQTAAAGVVTPPAAAQSASLHKVNDNPLAEAFVTTSVQLGASPSKHAFHSWTSQVWTLACKPVPVPGGASHIKSMHNYFVLAMLQSSQTKNFICQPGYNASGLEALASQL
jgi:hypothetical protein